MTRLVVLMIFSELQAGCDRRARNFTSDIKDSKIYTELLLQVLMLILHARRSYLILNIDDLPGADAEYVDVDADDAYSQIAPADLCVDKSAMEKRLLGDRAEVAIYKIMMMMTMTMMTMTMMAMTAAMTMTMNTAMRMTMTICR